MLNIQSPLSGIRSPFGRRGGFSPALLFAGSEPGVWYDPSDLTTLFTDVAGTTPVTTAGQTVALMLDKSKGLVLGPELATVSSVVADPIGTGSGFNNYTVSVGLTAGVPYRIEFTVENYDGTGTLGLAGNTGSYEPDLPIENVSGTINKTYSIIGFSAAGTAVTLFTRLTNTCNFTNISVKELPGYHATQATAAARPEYQTDGTYHWLSFDGVDDFMTSATPAITFQDAAVFLGASAESTESLSFLFGAQDGSADRHYLQRTDLDELQLVNVADSFRAVNAGSAIGKFVATGTRVSTSLVARRNGTQEATNTQSGNTIFTTSGNFFIAKNTTFNAITPASMNFYSGIWVQKSVDTGTIENAETYVAGKTGVTL